MSWLLITASLCGSFSGGLLVGSWLYSHLRSIERRRENDRKAHWKDLHG